MRPIKYDQIKVIKKRKDGIEYYQVSMPYNKSLSIISKAFKTEEEKLLIKSFLSKDISEKDKIKIAYNIRYMIRMEPSLNNPE